MENFELRKAFIDICRGFTVETYDRASVYVKHFSHFEQFDLELDKKKHYEHALSRKIKTYAEKIEWLALEGIWTKKEESELVQAGSFIKNLKKTRSKLTIQVQIKNIDKQIQEAEAKWRSLEGKKRNLVGLTAESYAEEKMQNTYVFLSFFKDSKLETPLFTEKEFKKLDDEVIYELLDLYINYINRFTHENLKQISISDFFTNYFYLTEDLTKFFNRPIMNFTFNQVNLSSYGQYFKKLLSNFDIPENIKDNPDEIEKYIIRLQNKGKMKLPEEGRVGVIGATKEGDGEFFGEQEDMITRLASMGGVNDIFDANNKMKTLKK